VSVRVGIDGFARIGRNALRAAQSSQAGVELGQQVLVHAHA
jgi:glyceraldehyde-3-phosphate dehydrogenase/erythrose-4-phosphate dehydrogenase